jgi:hypothetical protein
MKKNPEIELMKIETRLDRIQNEARKALGECRKVLEYYKGARQKTLKCYGVKKHWEHYVAKDRTKRQNHE